MAESNSKMNEIFSRIAAILTYYANRNNRYVPIDWIESDYYSDFGEHLDTVASLNSDGSIVNLILSLGFKVQDYMVNTYVEARNRDVAHRAINHMRHGNLPNNSVQSHRRNQAREPYDFVPYVPPQERILSVVPDKNDNTPARIHPVASSMNDRIPIAQDRIASTAPDKNGSIPTAAAKTPIRPGRFTFPRGTMAARSAQQAAAIGATIGQPVVTPVSEPSVAQYVPAPEQKPVPLPREIPIAQDRIASTAPDKNGSIPTAAAKTPIRPGRFTFPRGTMAARSAQQAAANGAIIEQPVVTPVSEPSVAQNVPAQEQKPIPLPRKLKPKKI